MKHSASIVLRNNSRFLFYLRDEKPDIIYPGHWAFIGGYREANETSLQALRREISEELPNADISNISYLGKITIKNNPACQDHDIDVFRGDLEQEIEELILTEGQKLGYFTLEDIPSLRMPSPLKEFMLAHTHDLSL